MFTISKSFVILIAIFAMALHAQPPTRDVSKESARRSAEWIRDSIIYQIFPRQYSSKGDFNSITADLYRLQRLGVNILWLMPVHPIGQEKKKGTIGSPYAVRDYYAVNRDYGTPADLKRLIREAHKRDLKVIIDVVINHTAWDNKLISQHPEFYKKNERGEIVPPVADWADVAGLDYSKPAVRRYVIDMLKSWIRDYDLDGFRCDVAGMIPTEFWEEARAEIDRVKPNTIWLAEAEKPELLVKAFDLDYGWHMHSTLTAVVQGTKPASELRKVWEEQIRIFPRGSIRMRFSDNHDERRAIARFGERGALAAEAFAFTIDGVPMIYNGMEVGDTTESGAPALFEKMPIFWKIAERRPEFPRFYRSMIDLRKNSIALRRGEVAWVRNSDESRIVTFVRRAAGQEVLVAINMTSTPFAGSVDVRGNFVEVSPDLSAPLAPGESAPRATENPNVELPKLNLGSFGVRVFRRGE